MEVYWPMESLPRYRKTRIAPTPSGYLHPGNALSFLLTAALAKKTGAEVLLRIDDLDGLRVRNDYIQDIFDTLRFLGIVWNEGPHSPEEHAQQFAQIHRMSLYRRMLQKLRDEGHVFACNCSRTQILQHNANGAYPGTCTNKGLSLDSIGVSWRLHTRPNQLMRVKKIDGSVITSSLPAHMQAFVVRKKDGMPSYQLTSLADDLHFGVDLLVRGADLWPSTLAQLHLASLLGQQDFLNASFFHHSLLKNANGEKLSKSAGALSVRQMRSKGKQPADLLQFFTQSFCLDEWASDLF